MQNAEGRTKSPCPAQPLSSKLHSRLIFTSGCQLEVRIDSVCCVVAVGEGIG